jgi:methionine synthase II (cobalamin-independent)
VSEIAQPAEQMEDPQQEYVEVEQVNQMLQEEAESRTDEVLTPAAEASIVEQLTKQFTDAGIEVVEVVDRTWALGIPGKPDLPCEGYEDWAKQYEEMADKVAKSKLAPEAKLSKLEELKKSNHRIFSMLKVEQSLQHTKAMVTRRNQIEAKV